MFHRSTALLAVLVLVVAACSSDESAADTTTTVAPSNTHQDTTTTVAPSNTHQDTTTTSEPEPALGPLETIVTSLEFDAETGEVTEVEEVAGPTNYPELLDAGIDAGLWDELGGLELLLGHAVGAVPSDEVPGTDTLLTREFTDLLERAHALSLSDEYSNDQLAPIRRWHELAVPSAETMEMLENTSRQVGFKSLRNTSPAAQASNCSSIDAGDFSDWGVVEGCYLLWSESVQGVTIRVFYPAWYEEDPANAGLALAAGQALVQAIDTFADFGPVTDIDAIFSLVDTEGSDETMAVANDDATWGQASRGGACPITLFPLGFNDEFENTLAHEAWHCVQREMGFPRGVRSGASWYEEGGAQYFANVVFPETGWFSTFDSRSRTVALGDMSYEAWVWWQFLGSRESPRGVADLHKQMSADGDGGQGAMVGRGEQFQRFVIELMAGKIEGPVTLPASGRVNSRQQVSKNDTGKELEFTTGGFIAARYAIRYDQELRVFESDMSPDDIRMAMVEWTARYSPAAWKGVFPEVRSKCKNTTYYVVAVTTETPQNGLTSKMKIDKIEEAVCDPCVLGTWSLDLQTFEDLIKSNAPPTPGSDFSISGGAYYVAFDDQGKVHEQRDGLTITVSAQGQSLDMIINSFGTGDYSADGENMAMSNVIDYFVEVDVGGFGGGGIDATDFGATSGSGTYVCTNDDVTITIPEGTVRWIRVDRILEPPPIPDS